MVVIEKTTNTPELLIDSDEGNVELIGRCFPENAVAFFTKVKEKILEIEKEKMSIVFSLDYINTSSTKYLLNLLKELSEKYKTNIVWMYEYDDEDMLDTGDYFKDVLDIDVELRVLSDI